MTVAAILAAVTGCGAGLDHGRDGGLVVRHGDSLPTELLLAIADHEGEILRVLGGDEDSSVPGATPAGLSSATPSGEVRRVSGWDQHPPGSQPRHSCVAVDLAAAVGLGPEDPLACARLERDAAFVAHALVRDEVGCARPHQCDTCFWARQGPWRLEARGSIPPLRLGLLEALVAIANRDQVAFPAEAVREVAAAVDDGFWVALFNGPSVTLDLAAPLATP